MVIFCSAAAADVQVSSCNTLHFSNFFRFKVKMAQPSYVIEQAVRLFHHYWHLGLQPTFNLKTLSNGAICVSSDVLLLPPNVQFHEQNSPNISRRRKSSRNARKNRRSRRLANHNKYPEDNDESNNQDDDNDVSYEEKELELFLEPPEPEISTQSTLPEYSSIQSKTLDHATTVQAAVQAVNVNVDVACQAANFHRSKLSISECVTTSIPPRPIYHPAIINASMAFFKKHPSNLTEDEISKFNCYLKRKQELGEPVEKDVIFQPSSMRNCLHCGYPT